MASRYDRIQDIDNDTDFYSFLRKKRGNIKNIRHQETPLMRHPSVSQRASAKTTSHIWSYGDRFYSLAHKYYNNPEYWWVIAWWNLYPTEADVKTGDYIQIPLDLEKALMILGVY